MPATPARTHANKRRYPRKGRVRLNSPRRWYARAIRKSGITPRLPRVNSLISGHQSKQEILHARDSIYSFNPLLLRGGFISNSLRAHDDRAYLPTFRGITLILPGSFSLMTVLICWRDSSFLDELLWRWLKTNKLLIWSTAAFLLFDLFSHAAWTLYTHRVLSIVGLNLFFFLLLLMNSQNRRKISSLSVKIILKTISASIVLPY